MPRCLVLIGKALGEEGLLGLKIDSDASAGNWQYQSVTPAHKAHCISQEHAWRVQESELQIYKRQSRLSSS